MKKTEDQYNLELFNKIKNLSDSAEDYIELKNILMEYENRDGDAGWWAVVFGLLLSGSLLGILICTVFGN